MSRLSFSSSVIVLLYLNTVELTFLLFNYLVVLDYSIDLEPLPERLNRLSLWSVDIVDPGLVFILYFSDLVCHFVSFVWGTFDASTFMQ